MSFSTVIFPLLCHLKTYSNRTLYTTESFPTYSWKELSTGDPSVGAAEDTVVVTPLPHTGQKGQASVIIVANFFVLVLRVFFFLVAVFNIF